MNKYYYDLHVHSCLSPCGDDQSTPYNIAGMAALNGLDIIALTDHNSTANCPAFYKAAEQYGVIPVTGMELTAAEDVHMVCLFPTLESTLSFGKEIENRRIKIENKVKIFGHQLIMGDEDTLLGEDAFLLPNATSVSIDEACGLAEKYSGVCYPAHIDREANGIVAVLGMIPENLCFHTVEFKDAANIADYRERKIIGDGFVAVSSDAHTLGDINEAENFLMLSASKSNPDAVRKELIDFLRGAK